MACHLQDNTREVTYLPACESKCLLFRLYDGIENSEDNKISFSSFLPLKSLTSFSRPGIPNSLYIETHISWDFAKNIQIPYFSQQEGTIYFKSPFKVEVFGICEEGTL
ncbi:13982_t:CDS:2 [Cetraspora pellucida]|uniref:13982_t:CDS:1 n=1 Tax=Cetraspora pellucida TaxID=1433469 RepID=A0A9N9A136_9GLOM|nr:13982_t:CDS:2 [Cetraspora pellucida]